ncbi:Lysoplasmalogenase-like protein TMEM86A [Amphibalanus amphitrite]|uniref:lysoplasmalogenase n=1 Tax=Amphibalanus amphitrite TaxID=1232801 RepID=A0A6A4WKQ4_AMPAM|nr:Lysoplasmalogenase-like protein TMEM86A [Amphibalanus amphitrite]
MIKSVGPKLVPFFKTAAVYFVLFIPEDRPSWLALVIKCLPILSLLIFVLLHGMSLGDEYAYARRIMLGLSCCMLGDALLVFPGFFLEGMAAFAAGHLFYISAFGFKPVNPYAGAVLYSLGAAGKLPVLYSLGAAGKLPVLYSLGAAGELPVLYSLGATGKLPVLYSLGATGKLPVLYSLGAAGKLPVLYSLGAAAPYLLMPDAEALYLLMPGAEALYLLMPGAEALYLLMPGAEGVFVVGLPVYAGALITMVWRAIARVRLLEDFWTWTKLCSCIGGICFVISDTFIGFHVFYGAPYIQAAVMVLYYAGQLGIALSVVDSKASYLDARRREKQKLTADGATKSALNAAAPCATIAAAPCATIAAAPCATMAAAAAVAAAQ